MSSLAWTVLGAYFTSCLAVGIKARAMERGLSRWVLIGLICTPFFGLVLLIVAGAAFEVQE